MKKILIYILPFFIFGSVFSQNDEKIYLSGLVKDNLGNNLPFVNIIIKNKRLGTISDETGNFSFFVHSNDTLLFSSIGYKKSFFIVPNIKENHLEIKQVLKVDTIILPQANVLPWQNYEEFKHAFVHLYIPTDNIDRAYDNFALIERQLLADDDDMPASSGVGYHIYMQKHYDKLYTNGQTQSIKLLDPIAWAKFFKALENGDFKREEED